MFGATPRFNIPRFNTPGFNTEASGIVESWNQIFRKMIHHVIIDNRRQWKYLPKIEENMDLDQWRNQKGFGVKAPHWLLGQYISCTL